MNFEVVICLKRLLLIFFVNTFLFSADIKIHQDQKSIESMLLQSYSQTQLQRCNHEDLRS